MKTDAEVVTSFDDVEMIKREHLWPQAQLCLKRLHPDLPAGTRPDLNNQQFARMQKGSADVFLLKMFVVERVMHYRDAEAIVADGWRVD